jgi:hypothetical protein
LPKWGRIHAGRAGCRAGVFGHPDRAGTALGSSEALSTLINKTSSTKYPKQVPGLPVQMLSGLPAWLNTDPNFGLAAATSCAMPGTDGCIQLRHG